MQDYLNDVYDESAEPVKLTQSQKDTLVQDAIRKRRNWMDMTRTYRETAIEVRQLYLENRPDGQEFRSADVELDSKSRVRLPVMAQSIDSTLAQQHLGTFPTDERFFKAKPMNEASRDSQLAYEEISEARMVKLNFIQKSKMDRMNAMLDGVSAAWHPFCRKTRRRANYTPKTLFGSPIGKPRESYVEQVYLEKSYVEQVYLEGTDFIPLNIEDWWVDPTCDDFDACNFIWRQWIHVEHLKSIDSYENTADVTTFSKLHNDADSRLWENYQLMDFDVDISDMESRMGCNMAMLFEEWGDFYIDEKLYENHVLVYSNESVFHGFFKNPFDHGFKPFSISAYVPIPGTLMGKSLGKDIVPLAHAYDAFLNGGIDIVNSAAGPIFTYLASDEALVEFFSEGKRVIEPGMAIPVRNHDSLRAIQTDLQNLQVIAQLMQRLKEEIRESTGGVPYATGGVSQADQERTATEVNTLASGASTRYQDLIQGYEDAKLKRYLSMWFENDRQFMSEPVFADEDMITPDMIKQMDYEFEVIGSKAAMSQSKEATSLLGILGMMPQLFQLGTFKVKGDIVEVDINGMLRQIGRSQGARNIDDYLDVVMTQDEAQQQQQQGSGLEAVLNGLGQANPAGAPVDLGAILGQGGVVAPQAIPQ